MGLNYVNENGNKTELIKNKDINRAIKGECKIFIDGNEEYTEVFTENLLTNNILYEMIAKQLTEQVKVENYNENFTTLEEVADLNNFNTGNCFNSIMLGYSESDEDARFDNIKGTITGFVDFNKSVDTTNNLEGYSLYTTDYRDGKITLECSFSSSKINNNKVNQVWVGMASGLDESKGKGGQMINLNKQYNVLSDVKNGSAVFAFNKLFIADGSRCYIYNFYVNQDTKILNLDLYLECSLPANANTFCYNKETNLFYIQDDNKTIYIMNFDKEFTVLSQKTLEFSIDIASFGQNLICCKTFLESYYDEVKQVFIYDKDFNLLTINALPDTFKGSTGGIETNWNEDFILLFSQDFDSPSFMYILDNNLNIISYVLSEFYVNGFTKIQYNTKNMFYMDKGIYKASINHSTQTKLAKTIEKNLGQSMKVSYTFTFN